MTGPVHVESTGGPQCQYFVVRKKRLCRMTVRPGKQYCGEHEPQPKTDDDKADKRIVCPNDPKHTCFASKLEKHLSICNARQQEEPEYIIHNINLGTEIDSCPKIPLTEVPLKSVMHVINKINLLYDEYLKDKIIELPTKPIHNAVLEEFNEDGREESSLRHLRQVSSLLHLVEEEGLVQPDTCYVDLGAGKGQLGAYAWCAWCGGEDGKGTVVLVERAALRHKRDRRAELTRVRHDLAHLSLAHLPTVRAASTVVGLAKHLCGAATDLALRCLCAADVEEKVSGLVLATCCHHRCELQHYVAEHVLREHGVSAEDFNVTLGLVSWATCGDGRSRERRAMEAEGPERTEIEETEGTRTEPAGRESEEPNHVTPKAAGPDQAAQVETEPGRARLDVNSRAEVGRRAKALVDWGRVQFLRERGFRARLVRFVSADVSLENVCIVATRRLPHI